MKKALISPNENPISYISAWTEAIPHKPIFANYENSCRVAEVADQEFEIAYPLFWVDCPDSTISNEVYFNTATNEILPIVNAPYPTQE